MAVLSNFQKWMRDELIKQYASQGYGATKTVEALKGTEFSIRKQEGLRTYARYAGIPQKADTLKFIPKSKAPARDSFTTPTGWISKNYRYNVEWTVRDPETGNEYTRGTRVISDSALTVGQIESKATDAVTGIAERYNFTITKFNLQMAEHKSGAVWD